LKVKGVVKDGVRLSLLSLLRNVDMNNFTEGNEGNKGKEGQSSRVKAQGSKVKGQR
jgi:hypothetical protein